MPILDLYSSRMAAGQSTHDVWVYDKVPKVLRVQVSNIFKGALGTTEERAQYNSCGVYEFIKKRVAHEHGRPSLADQHLASADVLLCILKEQDTLLWLDVVELSSRCIIEARGRYTDHQRKLADITIRADEAVTELNERFRRAGFGYRFESGKIIRIDSEFLHQETTRPALSLLSDSRFAGADEEFRAAYDHLKAGQNKDCAVNALNALESTMKAICDAKGWKYLKGARATDLLKIVRRENLFPDFADQSFEQLLATLKSGLPAVRNEAGGHGQGSVPVEIPTYVAVYALNLAASKIRFLVEAFKNSER
jgi:hypothetical protein